jgi:hypothetical protein
MLAQESANLTRQGNSTEAWVEAALHEEWLHAAQMEAEARSGRDWEQTYTEVWNDPGLDPKLRAGAAQAYTGFEQLSDAQKGAEVMRMVLSARWSGTITERIHRAVQSFVDYLRGLDPAAQQSALFRETLARAEAVIRDAHGRGLVRGGKRHSGKGTKPALFAAPVVGMKLRDVGGDFPVDADQPDLMDISGRSDVIATRAAAWFRSAPTQIRAADGSSIQIWNKERDSFGTRVWHMIRVNESNSIDLSKARWIPNLLNTLRGAAVRLVNPRNGYRLYVKRYGNGMRHVVVVSPDGRVESQKALAGNLITQFPDERNPEIGKFTIEWVRGKVQ